MTPFAAVVGDFNPTNRTHRFTNDALDHLALRFEWVPTESVSPTAPEKQIAGFNAIWIAPASPYRSMDGALAAVRYARERGVPLVGT